MQTITMLLLLSLGWAAKEGSGLMKLELVSPQAAAEAWRGNQRWLEDCITKLLCVLGLDRFGDFTSEQVGRLMLTSSCMYVATWDHQRKCRQHVHVCCHGCARSSAVDGTDSCRSVPQTQFIQGSQL